MVPGDRPQRLPAVDPPGHHLLPDVEARAAFFPLYPMIVRAADRILPGGDTLAALAVSTALALVAVVLVGVLARRLYDNDVAERAMVLFAVFPGSFVLSYAYAEALLIVLAAVCLWFLLDERWLLAGVAAALATATRPNGVALVAACAVAAFLAIRAQPRLAVARRPAAGARSASSPSSCSSPPTPASRGRGSASSARRGGKGTSFGATAISNTISFLGHPLRVADRRPHRGVARRPRPRAVVPVAQAAAVADGRLHRRRHRADAAAGDGHGTAALPVHGVPAVHQRRRVVAAARPGRSGTSCSSAAAPGSPALDRALRRRSERDPVNGRGPSASPSSCRASTSGRRSS